MTTRTWGWIGLGVLTIVTLASFVVTIIAQAQANYAKATHFLLITCGDLGCTLMLYDNMSGSVDTTALDTTAAGGTNVPN